MKLNNSLNIQEVAWDDARGSLYAANGVLASLLDKLPKKHHFIRATYSYGDEILKNGQMQLPKIGGGTVDLTSDEISKSIQKDLSYRYVPLSLILSKSIEVYFDSGERIVPSKLISSGEMFGLWEIFDPPPNKFSQNVWSISAGARTTFMLPKIADTIAHNRLKRDYGITAYPPKKMLNQHSVFKDLILHKENKYWQCEILFFSRNWLKEESNIHNQKLHKYWLEEAWRQSFNCRNQMNYDIAWEAFSNEVTRRNWKPRPYIINTIKHLMAIGEGVFPGLAPSGTSEHSIPTYLIQDAYMKNYLLKHYAPILMQPSHLNNAPVYYSLSLPTLLEHAPQADNARSIMADMRELKQLMSVLLKSTDTQHISYDFFHSDTDQFSEIRPANEMLSEDSRLNEYPKKYGELLFSECSPFFRGCIRIKRNN